MIALIHHSIPDNSALAMNDMINFGLSGGLVGETIATKSTHLQHRETSVDSPRSVSPYFQLYSHLTCSLSTLRTGPTTLELTLLQYLQSDILLDDRSWKACKGTRITVPIRQADANVSFALSSSSHRPHPYTPPLNGVDSPQTAGGNAAFERESHQDTLFYAPSTPFATSEVALSAIQESENPLRDRRSHGHAQNFDGRSTSTFDTTPLDGTVTSSCNFQWNSSWDLPLFSLPHPIPTGDRSRFASTQPTLPPHVHFGDRRLYEDVKHPSATGPAEASRSDANTFFHAPSTPIATLDIDRSPLKSLNGEMSTNDLNVDLPISYQTIHRPSASSSGGMPYEDVGPSESRIVEADGLVNGPRARGAPTTEPAQSGQRRVAPKPMNVDEWEFPCLYPTCDMHIIPTKQAFQSHFNNNDEHQTAPSDVGTDGTIACPQPDCHQRVKPGSVAGHWLTHLNAKLRCATKGCNRQAGLRSDMTDRKTDQSTKSKGGSCTKHVYEIVLTDLEKKSLSGRRQDSAIGRKRPSDGDIEAVPSKRGRIDVAAY